MFTVHIGSSKDSMSERYAFVRLFCSFHDALPVDGDKKKCEFPLCVNLTLLQLSRNKSCPGKKKKSHFG